MIPFNALTSYRNELEAELKSILGYWMDFSLDESNGGFVGRINNDNVVDPNAPKGSVLNARILWSFAAAYNLTKYEPYLPIADRAFNYIKTYFVDHDFGGVYWLIDTKGEPIDSKKQIYAIAFTIYACSEYYLASQNYQAKELAIALYNDLLKHSFDPIRGGYLEAFDRDWKPLEDLRLSEKDANEMKTMNTHLHVLEAFTNLFRIWPNQALKHQIELLIVDFTKHIVQKETKNLTLFFDENWNPKSTTISYGHDIEAAWLLLEAAEAINDEQLIAQMSALAVDMAQVSRKGVDSDGGLWYEYEPAHDHLLKEKHWWVQAEAMVGFYNAWQISKNEEFLQLSMQAWAFVKSKIIDHQKGEWFWGIGEDVKIMKHEDKVGIWKCPYHNSRACIEIIKRINLLTS